MHESLACLSGLSLSEAILGGLIKTAFSIENPVIAASYSLIPTSCNAMTGHQMGFLND
jgi:hypothetical protein